MCYVQISVIAKKWKTMSKKNADQITKVNQDGQINKQL